MSRVLRVGIDGRCLRSSADRGVTRYTRELITELAREKQLDLNVLLEDPESNREILPENVKVTPTPFSSRLLHAAAGITGRPRLDQLFAEKIDLFWAPAPAPLAVSRETPFVLTVHDLSFEGRSRFFTPYEQFWHKVANPKRLAQRARRVIAVSHTTAEAISEQWAAPQAKITVVHNGISAPRAIPTESDTAVARQSFGIRKPYFLFVGALEPRKAPDLLAQAFHYARANGLQAELVFVGEGRLKKELVGSETLLVGRADEQIEQLMHGALAVVCPSLDEGFGMVPLEAALLDTPAIVSDIPAFQETLGSACWRFPRGDFEQLAQLLLTVAADAPARKKIAAEAKSTAQQFTWERAARETTTVFEEAVQ